jgi:ABC-type multidrug transport system ATPase subunit
VRVLQSLIQGFNLRNSRRVAAVLEQLGLADVAHSRIGSSERRGISGGQRRRLSIGLELLAQPSVLILDEPTSGALMFADCFRKLTGA